MDPFILITTGIISAILTYIMSVRLQHGPIRSSAFLSLVVGLFFYIFPDILSEYLTKNIPLVFIGASFVGMTSPKVLSSCKYIAASGLIFSLIYLTTSIFFAGSGGGLGTTACISVLMVFGFNVILYVIKIKKKMDS